jgi:hypothetical protein
VQEVGQQDDELGIGLRAGRADGLSPDLPELAVAAALGRLGAEEARQVPELDRLGLLVHPMLQVRAADRSGPLGAKRQRPPAAVIEAVHLLLHDVGRLPHPPREQLRRLKGGGLDPAVAGGAEDPVRELLERAAARRIGREHVECASRGLERAHGCAFTG